MALFSQKKKPQEESVVASPSLSNTKSLPTDRNLGQVIVCPRLTEKTVQKGEQNVYTFIVRRDATKFLVRDAIKALYNVTPVKVNIVNKKPAERTQGSRSRTKHVAGQKKAYVYLKKGDTINLV